MTALPALLEAIRAAHDANPALGAFVGFPDDLHEIDLTARHLPCADHMYGDALLKTADNPLARAFFAAGPEAFWRDTYAGTNIGDDFMNRFGCYCAIGSGGAWDSNQMKGYVVTMPPGLHYPWHHHPAEEMYVVLAGEAEFFREGEPMELLREGDTSFHASNQPHAMETRDSPVMCYVTWRNHFDTPPVLTERPVELP